MRTSKTEQTVLNGTHYVYVIIFVRLLFEVKPFTVAGSGLFCVTVIDFCNVSSYCLKGHFEAPSVGFMPLKTLQANNENVKPPLFWRGHQKSLFRCDYFHTKHNAELIFTPHSPQSFSNPSANTTVFILKATVHNNSLRCDRPKYCSSCKIKKKKISLYIFILQYRLYNKFIDRMLLLH